MSHAWLGLVRRHSSSTLIDLHVIQRVCTFTHLCFRVSASHLTHGVLNWSSTRHHSAVDLGVVGIDAPDPPSPKTVARMRCSVHSGCGGSQWWLQCWHSPPTVYLHAGHVSCVQTVLNMVGTSQTVTGGVHFGLQCVPESHGEITQLLPSVDFTVCKLLHTKCVRVGYITDHLCQT